MQLAARRPATGRFQIVLIEDADRLTEGASNALLKAVEEPPPHTVFLLCAPSTHPDDVSVTIRSRCRVLALRTPSGRVDRRGAGPAGRHRRRRWRSGRRRCRPGTSAGPGGWPATTRPASSGAACWPSRARCAASRTCSSRPDDLLAAAKGEATVDVRPAGRRRAGGTEDCARRRRHRQGCGRRGPRHRRRGQGAGAAAEVPGDPDRARRAGPCAGRPLRLLPGRDRPQPRLDGAADESGRRRATSMSPRPGSDRSVRCSGWTPCWPAGRRSS